MLSACHISTLWLVSSALEERVFFQEWFASGLFHGPALPEKVKILVIWTRNE